MKNKKILLLGLGGLVILLLSIRPFLFTLQLLITKYYQYRGDYKNKNYNLAFLKTLKIQPASVPYLNVELALKSALYSQDKKFLISIPESVLKQIKSKYQSSFFFQFLNDTKEFPIRIQDAFTIHILADPGLNEISKEILKQHYKSESPLYETQILELLWLQNNPDLANELMRICSCNSLLSKISPIVMENLKSSTHLLNKALDQYYHLNPSDQTKNLFSQPNSAKLSDKKNQLTSIKFFFEYYTHVSGKIDFQGIPLVKIISFMNSPSSKKQKIYTQFLTIPTLDKYCFIFSLNYFTTSLVKHVIFKFQNLGEIKVSPVVKKWQKIIAIIPGVNLKNKKVQFSIIQDQPSFFIFNDLSLLKLEIPYDPARFPSLPIQINLENQNPAESH